jgi:hypothetical protein
MPATPKRARRFYRLSPAERGPAALPLVGRLVTGQYRGPGGTLTPFAGQFIGIAADPVRLLPVAVIDERRSHMIALNLSSIYDLDAAPEPEPAKDPTP